MTRLSNIIASAQSTRSGDHLRTISETEANQIATALADASSAPLAARDAAWQRLLTAPDAFATAQARAIVQAALPRMIRLSSRDVTDEDFEGNVYQLSAQLDSKTSLHIGEASFEFGGATQTLLAGGGRFALYSTDGSMGGGEADGHAVMCFDLRTGRRSRVLDALGTVHAMREVSAPNGRRYVVVELQHNGEGPIHSAVIDPLRHGTVYFAENTTLADASLPWATLRTAPLIDEVVTPE